MAGKSKLPGVQSIFKLFLIFLSFFLFFNEKCYFQATCNSGLYKPMFHAFLDPEEERKRESERGTCSPFVFLPISKSSYWCVLLLFSIEKTNPVLILTKCILHTCEASVSPRGPLAGAAAVLQESGPCCAIPRGGPVLHGTASPVLTVVSVLNGLGQSPQWSCSPP